MGDFAGRAALVTGGSRGVGKAVALELARRGADVALVYRSSRALAEETRREIAALGVEALALQADVADAEAAAAAVSTAIGSLGDLHILVHSAGAQVDWKPVREHDARAWAAFVENDLIGAFNVIQPAVRHMHAKRFGVVVAISSIAAQMCQSRNSMGAAAKAGLEALIRVVAREEARHGIRANAIALGLTDTDQAREALAQWGEEASKKIIAKIPLGRMGKPEEVARFAAYLAGADGSYLTGKVIQLDGGQIISG